jgi:hypothetical protein
VYIVEIFMVSTDGGDGLDEPVEIEEEDDEDEVEDPNYLASTDDGSCSDSNDDENDCEKDFDEDLDIEEAYINGQHEIRQNKDKNLVERDEEEVDVEEAFINGEHRILVDPEYEYEEERRLNKQVKDRLSQLGLSPQTLKTKRRKLARDLENKLILKCAHQRIYENTPATIPATANPKSSRGGASSKSTRGGANSKSTRGGANSNSTRGGNCGAKNTRGGNGSAKGIRGMSNTGRGGRGGGSKGGCGGAQASRNAK